MIPLKLELSHFLSYRETAVLDFNTLHLACISGANGAGKSSILDGITWALFGQARSKNDDDLVNRLSALDGKTAEVKLTFRLENSVYRVIRRKTSKKAMGLEFQVATEAEWQNGRWKPLSEGKMRETQAAIETLLRMSYDTFINASFLLQGKADEFTTKTPNRRKEILADLLGVSQWDVYKEAATERRKLEEGRRDLLDAQLGEIEREAAEEPERQRVLLAAQGEQAVVQERLNDKERLLEQLRRAETAVSQQREMVKTIAATLSRAQRDLAALQKTRQTRQQERDSYQTILDQITKITADYAAWQEAERVLQEWQTKADAHNQLQQAKRPHELVVTQERTSLQSRQRELQTQAEKVAAAAAEKTSLNQQRTNTQDALTRLAGQLAELAQQEEALHAARAVLQQLEGDRGLWQKELTQLAGRAKQVQQVRDEKTAVSKNHQEAARMHTQLTAELAALSEKNQRYPLALADLNGLQAAQPRLKEQMDKIKERQTRLEGETGSECPLCGQPLTESHRQGILADLQTEGTQLGDQFRANKKQIETLTAEVAALDNALKQSPRLERDQQAQTQRLAKAEARLAEIEQVIAEWESTGQPRLAELEKWLKDDSAVSAQKQQVAALETAVQAKPKLEKEQQTAQRQLATTEARLHEVGKLEAEWEASSKAAAADVAHKLATNDYAREAQATLAALDEQIAQVGYDAAAHTAARQTHAALAQAQPRYQSLKQAEAAVKPLDTALADLAAQLTAQEQAVAETTAQHQTAVSQLETLAAGTGELRVVEDEVFRLREEVLVANRRVGAAQQKLDILADLRQRKVKLEEEKTAVSLRIQRFKLLEKACGRDGVQALLIEQALPEIEERANELLHRLTGGEMRVSFDTQKQLKSRDALAETLDIRIVDGAGERPYDNYSGGEQFRVNFAIRLALSQLLAKRAGARLQTLVIDEGFGSQDPSGRQRLIEAINTIQDDFARILVITHIDELRDAFPARIEVEKRPFGSAIRVHS